MSQNANKIYVVGYSNKIKGGLTNVTNVLMQIFPNMELHPYKLCYTPRSKAVGYYLISVIQYVRKMFITKRGTIVLLIIGSSGDAVRSIPFVILSKLRGLKICAQYHKSADIIINMVPTSFLRYLFNSTLKYVDIHCFLSKRLKEGFDEVFPNRFRSKIIPNPLDEKWITIPLLTNNERWRDIVFFGRWSWEKGIDDLLACMSQIQSDVTCEIYTDYLPELPYKNCQIFSWVTESEVMNIMQTAKLVVLPSYAEAFPTVLLEAAACGTPFLASNVAGIPDIAEESGGGRVFEVGNVKMFAELVDEMLSDQNSWQAMSVAGKKWVNNLSKQIIKQQWQDVFNSINV